MTLIVFFLLALAFSKFGSVTLGDNDAVPEYSFFSWISMLFAAGLGIGLMYFSVFEPIFHFSDPTFGFMDHVSRAKNAQLFTFFHWGVHTWAIYGVVDISLAYFAYRYKLPYFTKNEVIADILKQYERFLELSSEVKNEIFTDIASKR